MSTALQEPVERATNITVLREDDAFHNRQVVSLGETRQLAP